MSDETPLTGLGATLDRATQEIGSPLLAARVLTEVRRRRRRAGIVAVAGSAAAVATVIGVVQLPGSDGDPEPSAPSSTTAMPTQPPPTESLNPADAVQPMWDPFTVIDGAVQPTLLPAELDPPANPPSLAERAMEAAVIAWPAEGKDLRLLGPDGTWRSVPGTARAVSGTLRDVVKPALSSDGRQVAMSVNDGILIVDVTTGEQRTIPWPQALAGPWDSVPELLWEPHDEGWVVLHWEATWLVALDGTPRKAPYGGEYGAGLAIDPDGTVVEHRWDHHDVRVWREGQVITTAPFFRYGERLVTRHGLVALTGGGSGLPGNGGPMVIDPATGQLLAHAPINDPHAAYSDNGHLTAKGFLDDHTVLLLVGPVDFATSGVADAWHLVAWDIRTGDFSRLASGGPGMREIEVAGDVLAAEWAP